MSKFDKYAVSNLNSEEHHVLNHVYGRLMELTIEQALQQGVAAHRDGKLQDAERFYMAILRAQPLHPDANHNLGVLAVSVNKADAAIPLFKAALEANPKIEQFWLSYINALIKTEKFDDAREALADAQQVGVSAAKLHIFEEKLQSELSSSSNKPQQELGNPLQSHQDELSPAIELREVGRYKEAQKWLSKFVQHNPANPEALSLLSQVLLLDKEDAEAERVLAVAASINSELPSVYRNQARLLLKQSKTAEALEKAQLGCKQSPECSESLLVLAACLRANQRDLEALPLIEKILKVKSNYAEAYANRALIKLRVKDTTGAIEDVEMTVSLKPHLTQMWQLLSSLYYQANNLSDAIEALRSAHKNEPKNTTFMIQLGELLRQDSKASEAINILEQATELAPEDANAWTNLGVALQQEKRIADAKIAYEKALALNPESAAIASNLGAMAQEAEEWESALQYFGKALEIEPNLDEAHNNSGVALQKLGRLDEAEASFTQAIALKPDYAEALHNLGNTLRGLGRLDEAEASYTQAIILKPNHALAHSNLGVTLQKLGRLNEAEASYTQAIILKPESALAHSNLGATLKKLGRLNEAEASFTHATKLDPDLAEAHYNLGATLKELGRLNEAEASFKQSIALKSGLAEAHYNLGNTLKELGRLDEAEATYTQAITLKPDYALAHNNLGNTLKELGRLDEAAASYVQAITFKTDYAPAHNNLGNTLKELGRIDEAEASYKQAIALKPDYADAHSNLGIMLKELIKYEEAIHHFDLVNTDLAEAHALECLYINKSYAEFGKRLYSLSASENMNLRVAAVSSFAAHQMKKKDPYPFCKNPLDFIVINNLTEYDVNLDALLEDIIEEANGYQLTWEARTTKFGFQGPGSVFENASKTILLLESIIQQAVETYYDTFKSESNLFIKYWPRKYKLVGWYNRLVKNGHHTSHIHPTGWLSGVIYLKTTDLSNGDEGAIEFGLHGHELPITDANYPKKMHRPKKGDIILFPSSLFHRTIPFTTDSERCVIAFDLMPEAAKD